MNWSALSDSHPLIAQVIGQWEQFVKGRHAEGVYHEFLRKHANLFLVDGIGSYFAISKLKLGSELELDFAIPYENHSRGLYWELIEIKRPDFAPYTANGMPSAKLTEATQQIRNWQRWIQTSRTEAKRLFQTWSLRSVRCPNFSYTIIIGTRQNTKKWLHKRNQYSEENGVQVRSFDYLTDRIKQRVYRNQAFVGSGTWDANNPDLRKALANPFIEAFTDSQWKQFIREPDVCGPHFIASSCRVLLSQRTQNSDLVQRFTHALKLAKQRAAADPPAD